jgi:hypothetical protein
MTGSVAILSFHLWQISPVVTGSQEVQRWLTFQWHHGNEREQHIKPRGNQNISLEIV